MTQTAPSPSNRQRLRWIVAATAFSLILCCVLLGSWATADRNWEQAWKNRVRVETPVGVGKSYVLAWIGQNCDCLPYVDGAPCEDSLGNIPIVKLAGIDEAAASSYVRITVRRKDVAAGEKDHMRVYYFFGDEDRVIGRYYLPFHELAQFEHAHRLLASR